MNPLSFSSGMSRAGDFEPALAANHSIGIDITEMSSNAMKRLAAALATSTASVFVDSGAFGHFRKQERTGKPQTAIDFRVIFDRYESLASAIGQADDSGYSNERVFFVMPDVVGDQRATLALLAEHADEVRAFVSFANPIFPLQRGELSLAEFFAEVVSIIGRDDIVVGLPSKAAAVPNDQVDEFLELYGDVVFGVHILGAATPKSAGARLESLRAVGFDGQVSMDANRLRALWNRHTSRPEALERLLAGLPPKRKCDVEAEYGVAA